MRIKKSKEIKNVNICLYVLFCLLTIFGVWSFFSPQKWDLTSLVFLIFIVFILYLLINLEWEVSFSGIICFAFWGKIKVKSYLWSDFSYIGPLLVVGKGREFTNKMLVCAEQKPFKRYVNSSAYTLRGHYLAFEDTEENRKLFSPYFKMPL